MKNLLIYIFLFLGALTIVSAQEESPFITYDVPSQNLLKYNRFLINPTFSTVREDKSYFNLLHRNQSVSFDDNNQAYFLSYSGRISDHTGLGLSLYTQREGIVSNYGVLANYAYGVKLSEKSNFTFGANLSYYSSGLDESRANPVEIDPLLSGFQDNSLLSFQPGFNISYGQFDFGVFAENLFDYNLKTSESITEFKDKTFSSHLQYTHQFKNAAGILESGRLIPLARARKVGEDEVVLGGSVILDLPKLGWVQGGYDSFYGASAGIGFNLNRRLSLGYTMEKGLSNNFDNFGVTHEISFAYSFTPNLTEDRVMLEDNEDALVENTEETDIDEPFSSKDEEIEELKRRLAENDAILAELMFRQDSIESNRQKDLERRYQMAMNLVRRETKGERPDIEDQVKQIYEINNDKTAVAIAPETENIQENKIQTPIKEEESAVAYTAADKTKAPVQRPQVTQDNTQQKAIAAVKKQKPVKSRKFKDLNGVKDGYYVVANVYKGGHYLEKFVNDLANQGIDADYIDNPKNGLKYVYLERYDSWQEAVAAHKSGINGAYDGELWIMNVDNRYSNEAYVENTNKIREKNAKYGTDVLQKNVVVRDNIDAAAQEPKNFAINGTGSGYYIIANVFANPKNANRFVKLLNTQGLSASYFINPENNYRYVYLKRHESWNNALISYYTKLNDSYDDKMWIMRVTPNLIT
ncbi:PorP/SprF family type IX secretion system membrane protein [Muriicola sp. Z0-33]|uniref:PorP/SprF family type IX secretion system membrane protein n=1 Tax=Muriicola sp. Z0-33 TaxID=2816957 RepID=UPI0022380FF2|nr:PorP/SprF family type IX secretion system membrane protein [Muriicola sp. Z0-33]MCW5514679.1 PorP/SprF family type IX secretion system membrane protein [Muriicola sp. Z0-33]